MRLFRTHKQHLIYLWAWAWFILVSAAWLCIYCEAVVATGELFALYDITSNIKKKLGGTSLGTILEWVGGALLWWRIVKVVVLHGSPFAFGKQYTIGRIHRTRTGLGVTMVYIGEKPFLLKNLRRELKKGWKEKWKEKWVEKRFEGEPNYDSVNLLYGAIFRPHPRSDKTVRSRLEYLLLALPFGLVLLITESKTRILFAPVGERAKLYDEHVDLFEHEKEPE